MRLMLDWAVVLRISIPHPPLGDGTTVMGNDDGSLMMLSIDSGSSSMTPGRINSFSRYSSRDITSVSAAIFVVFFFFSSGLSASPRNGKANSCNSRRKSIFCVNCLSQSSTHSVSKLHNSICRNRCAFGRTNRKSPENYRLQSQYAANIVCWPLECDGRRAPQARFRHSICVLLIRLTNDRLRHHRNRSQNDLRRAIQPNNALIKVIYARDPSNWMN